MTTSMTWSTSVLSPGRVVSKRKASRVDVVCGAGVRTYHRQALCWDWCDPIQSFADCHNSVVSSFCICFLRCLCRKNAFLVLWLLSVTDYMVSFSGVFIMSKTKTKVYFIATLYPIIWSSLNKLASYYCDKCVCVVSNYYGAVLPRRRPHYVSMLSVCLSVRPVPPPRGKTKRPRKTKLGRKGPWDTSTPWTNFKVSSCCLGGPTVPESQRAST